MSIATLPSELHILIVRFLLNDSKSFFSFELICKSTRAHLSNYQAVFQYVFPRDYFKVVYRVKETMMVYRDLQLSPPVSERLLWKRMLMNYSSLGYSEERYNRLYQEGERDRQVTDKLRRVDELKSKHNNKKKMPEVKIVLLGLGPCGKSALTLNFVQQRFLTENDPTLEDSYRKHLCIDDTVWAVNITDTSGMEEFKSLREQYIKLNDGFMIVFEVTSIANMREAVDLAAQVFNVRSSNDIAMLLVGNKVDKENERQCKREDLEKEWSARNLPLEQLRYLEASAKFAENVDLAFEMLSQLAVIKKQQTVAQEPLKPQKNGCKVN